MFWNGVAHKFSSEETCKICSSGKADTLEHFISECSALQGFRKNFNLLNPECDSNVCSLSELVTCSDSGVFLRFMRYLKAVLNARAFALAWLSSTFGLDMLIASLSLFSIIFAVTVAPPSIHSSLLQYMVLLLLLLCEVIKLAGNVEISFGNFIMV